MGWDVPQTELLLVQTEAEEERGKGWAPAGKCWDGLISVYITDREKSHPAIAYSNFMVIESQLG